MKPTIETQFLAAERSDLIATLKALAALWQDQQDFWGDLSFLNEPQELTSFASVEELFTHLNPGEHQA